MSKKVFKTNSTHNKSDSAIFKNGEKEKGGLSLLVVMGSTKVVI